MKKVKGKNKKILISCVILALFLGYAIDGAITYLQVRNTCYQLHMISSIEELNFLDRYKAGELFPRKNADSVKINYAAKLNYHGRTVEVEAYEFSSEKDAECWYGGKSYTPIWPDDKCDWKCTGPERLSVTTIMFYQDQFGVIIRAKSKTALLSFLNYWCNMTDTPFRYTPFIYGRERNTFL